MNNLTPAEINHILSKQADDEDPRKPVRKIMDDAVFPAAGMTAGLAVGAVNAVSKLKYTERTRQVPLQ